jgi:hypothetical protein
MTADDILHEKNLFSVGRVEETALELSFSTSEGDCVVLVLRLAG